MNMQSSLAELSRVTRSKCGRLVIAAAVLASSQSISNAQQPKTTAEIEAEKILQSRSETRNILAGRILRMEGSAADLLVDDRSTPFTYDDFTIFEIDGKKGSYEDIPVGADVEFFPDTTKDGRIYKMSYKTPGAGRILTNEVDDEAEVVLPTGNLPDAEMKKPATASSAPSSASEAEGIPSLSEAADDIKVDTNPVEPADIGAELKTTTDGVLVMNVEKNKPAHQAGLQPGDIITKVGDKNLSTDKGVEREIAKYNPNAPVEITIERGGEKERLSMNLPSTHEPKMEVTAKKPTQSPTVQRDLNTKNLGWKLAEVDEKIVIAEVDPISVVGASDAEEGDQILQVNGLLISSVVDVQNALKRSELDQIAKLTLQRGPETVFVTLGDSSESDTPGVKTQEKEAPSIQPAKSGSKQTSQSDLWDMINRQQAQIFELQQELKQLKSGNAGR